MKERFSAFCFRNGQIEIGRNTPKGALRLARGSMEDLQRAIHGKARLAYDNKTWLVPGIPEAENDDDALQAARVFRLRLQAPGSGLK